MATLLAGVDVGPLAATAPALSSGLSLAAFIAALNGTTVGGCGGFPTGQCTALACAWARNLGLGTPCGSCAAPNHCDGACWSGGSYPGWSWVPYAAGKVPSPGDLVAYHPCTQDGIGVSGHVGIFVSGTASRYTGFDQNWNGPTCKLISHGYECVLGWQHPGVGAPPPAPCVPACVPPATCSNGHCVAPVTMVEQTVGIGLLVAAGALALLALRPDIRADLERREQELVRSASSGFPLRTRRGVNPLRTPDRRGAGFR